MQQIENILHKVYLQLDAWSVDKDFVGKNINLKVHKVERNTDYETIFPPPPPWVLEQMARDEEARRAKPSVIDANPLVKAVGPEQAEEGAALEPKKISAQDALAAFAGFGGGTAKTLPMPTLLRRSKRKDKLLFLASEFLDLQVLDVFLQVIRNRRRRNGM